MKNSPCLVAFCLAMVLAGLLFALPNVWRGVVRQMGVAESDGCGENGASSR